MANNSARIAGADMNKFIGYITTVADVSQKSAESVGESFKTIFSRFGNVKAGKFEATSLDMAAEGYDEGDFESLNDIESVLTKIGIKVRDTATTWRDIDDILTDIGKKWSTWDTTTKNAVATAVASTRQRENVITLFENWDEVEKFREVAENAYGTATEKMSAYSESVEASKKRLTTAVEELAGDINGSNYIKSFYEALTFVVENLETLGIVLSGLALTTNFSKAMDLFTNGLTKLSIRMYNQADSFNLASPLKQDFRNWTSFASIVRNKDQYTPQELQARDAWLWQETYLQRPVKTFDDYYNSYQLFSEEKAEIARLKKEGNIDAAQAYEENVRSRYAYSYINDRNEIIGNNKYGSISYRDEPNKASAKDVSREFREQLRHEPLFGETREAIKNKFTSSKTQFLEGLNQKDLTARQQLYGDELQKSVDTMDANNKIITQENVTKAKTVQNEMLALDAKSQLILSDVLLNSATQEEVKEKFMNIEASEQEKLAKYLLSEADYQQYISTEDAAVKQNLLSTAAEKLAAKYDELGGIAKKVGLNLQKSGSSPSALLRSMVGAGNIAGSVLGGSVGQSFASNVGLNGTGQTLAMLGTAALGKKAGAAIMEGIGTGNIAGALAGGPGIALVSLLAMAAFNAIKKIKAKILAEAQEEFKTAKEDFEKIRDLTTTAEKYDELATGVNKFGKNLSLTDEEYADFLNYSNELAEAFPELVAYTDSEGNSILKMGNAADIASGQVLNMTDTIAKAKKEAQELADIKLLDKDVLKDALENAQDEYKDLKGKIDNRYTTIADLKSQKEEVQLNIGLPEIERKQQIADLDKQIAQLEREITGYKKQQTQITNSMNDYTLAEARSSGYFDNLTEEESSLMSMALQGVSLYNKHGGALNRKQYLKNIDAIALEMTNLFNNSPEAMKIAMGIDTAETAGEVHEARQDLLSVLQEEFGKDGFSPDELKVMISLGFEYDKKTNSFIDTEDYLESLKRLGVADYYKSNKLALNKVKNLNSEDIGNIYRWVNSGEIAPDANLDLVKRLLKSERGISRYSKYSRDEYFENQQSITDELPNLLADNFNLDKDAMKNLEVTDIFADYKTNIREGIEDVRQEILNGTITTWEDLETELKAVKNLQIGNIISDFGAQTQAVIEDIFPDDFSLDGITNEFEKLKKVLDTMGETYDKLAAAQKEQVENGGKLTMSTTLDLLATNENYIDALDITTDGIKLKTDAEKIMAQAQMVAAESTIRAAQADTIQAGAAVEDRIAQIQKALGVQQVVPATFNQIQATNDAIKAGNELNEGVAESVNLLGHWVDIIAEVLNGNFGTALKKVLGGVKDTVKAKTQDTIETTIQELDSENELIEELKDLVGAGAVSGRGRINWNNIDENSTYGRWIKRYGTYEEFLKKIEEYNGNYDEFLKKEGFTDEVKNTTTELQKWKDILGLINEEYITMINHQKRVFDQTKDLESETKEYFELQEKWLTKLIEKQENYLSRMGVTSIEDLDSMSFDDETYDKVKEALEDVQSLKVELANLDDKRYQLQLDILGVMGDMTEKQAELLKAKIATADSTLEELQYTKEYYDAVRELIKQKKEIAEYNKDIAEYQLEYLKGQATLADYTENTKYTKAIKNAETALIQARDAAKEMVTTVYEQMVQYYTKIGYSEEEASTMAKQSSDYREAMKEYIEAQQALGDLYMEDFNNKIDAIERRLEELETTKPNKWASDWDKETNRVTKSALDKIKEFYGEAVKYADEDYIKNLTEEELQNLSGVNAAYVRTARTAYDTLVKYSSMLTDEQVKILPEIYYIG